MMPPKASSRRSARSGLASNRASSPPEQSRNRESESPVSRQARSTRSQSRESQQEQRGFMKKQGRPRKATSRESSVDSVNSSISKISNRADSTRQGSRTAALSRDLSMVAEAIEEEQPDEEENMATEVEALNRQLQSPEAASQISGTTAVTSQSQSQLANIEPEAGEMLPKLFAHAESILNLLAPEKASEQSIHQIIKNLMAPGSKVARELRDTEAEFDVVKRSYGHDDYISKELVFKKLFESDKPGNGDWRPDALLHAANISILLKRFMVIQRKNSDTVEHLGRLDSFFPEMFISEFDEENIRWGRSALIEASFSFGLEIRTQYAIASLEASKEADDFDPEYILTSVFHHLPDDEAFNVSHASRDETLKDIFPNGPPNSPEQVHDIRNRFYEIKDTFNSAKEAIESRDLVNFDQLEEAYPWRAFLTNMVDWGRLRHREIDQSIVNQGGLDDLLATWETALHAFNSDSESASEQSSIHPASPSKSGFRPTKTGSSTVPAPSAPSAGIGSSTTIQQRAAASNMDQDLREDDYIADYDQGDIEEDPEQERRLDTGKNPLSKYADSVLKANKVRNKENIPTQDPPRRRRLLDSQPNAQSTRFSSEEPEDAGPSTSKRHPAMEDDEADSDTEAFERDQRTHPPSKKRSPVDNPNLSKTSQSKRARPNTHPNEVHAEGRNAAHRRRRVAENPVEASSANVERHRPAKASNVSNVARSRKEGPIQVPVVEDDEDDNSVRPTPTQVSVMAREFTAQRKLYKPSKGRTPWSDNDSVCLIDLIEKYGCAWALIHKEGQWEVERDQGAVKDKARNLKVGFLTAEMELPVGFEDVHLGQKEIKKVKASLPDWVPDWPMPKENQAKAS